MLTAAVSLQIHLLSAGLHRQKKPGRISGLTSSLVGGPPIISLPFTFNSVPNIDTCHRAWRDSRSPRPHNTKHRVWARSEHANSLNERNPHKHASRRTCLKVCRLFHYGSIIWLVIHTIPPSNYGEDLRSINVAVARNRKQNGTQWPPREIYFHLLPFLNSTPRNAWILCSFLPLHETKIHFLKGN